MATIVPYEVAYPVNFQSGGDVTKEAFGKHIQEIERIYGIINGLNASKVSADEFKSKLQSHIDDSNPHPNLNLSNTQGTLPSSRITGNFDFSRITGSLDTSRITGNFDTSRINGLANFINGKIPSVISASTRAENGFVEINESLIINWGKIKFSSRNTGEVTANFVRSFPGQCRNVVASLGYSASSIDQDRQLFLLIRSYNKTSVTFQVQEDTDTERWDNVYISFIAIGF